MKNIIKALSLLSIFAVIPGAMAATSRVSMISRASPRLPSIAGYITAVTNGTTTTTTSSTSLWGDVDCINNYTDCITADDVCGADFEECTTNVLFHAQMPKCLNVLTQCSATGINSLFGTSAVTALSNVESTRVDGGVTEVVRYTYPLDGSILGQRIIGGAISNQLTTDQCVRRYTSCLQRDDVCGSDFELCTSQREFKKQAVLCASTLARCQNEGKKELFGSVENATALRPSGEDVRLKVMIDQGAQLAAMNAVKTCQRVTDNCLVSACLNNPWRCVEGTSMTKISAADFVGSATTEENTSTSKITKTGDTLTSDMDLYALTGSDIRKNLKAQCLETIGANKYCHMTYREKSPNNKDLMDIDLQEDVFSLAYAARKEMVNTKIQEELKKFDTKAKEACVETIASCAMRSCGGGIGSVCYSDARTSDGIAVNGKKTYGDIKSACAAIVNTDPNCIYAATASDGYEYAYINKTTFDTLFTEEDASATSADPIGAISYLNSLLATSYNDAAIENMRRQCKTIALSCVKSMCGTDYENCYRNRTDIMGGTYNTGQPRFDNSMNKMGGVLDYNIVIGLCMNTVTSSSVCEEHLKIAASDLRRLSDTQSWGSAKTVRSAWIDSNTTKASLIENPDTVVIGCTVSQTSDKCPSGIQEEPDDNGQCIGIMDENGCIYDKEVTQNIADYNLTNTASTLFQQLLVDVEKEVQAKYNAKLTKEQNVCLANNNGGIMGAAENGSTFMWVKLNSNKVPKSYAVKGLTAKQFKASNDLYGSFCRARITVTSDDKDIQNVLSKKDGANVYFAVGDTFTCGSWIDDKTMAEISEKVGERKLCEEGYGVWDTKTGKCSGMSTKEKIAYAWGTVAPALAGLGVGLGLSEGGLINKWMNSANEKNGISQANVDKWTELCTESASKAKDMSFSDGTDYQQQARLANAYAANAYRACSQMGIIENCEKYTVPSKYDEDKIKKFKGNMEGLEVTCTGYIPDGAENGKANKNARIAIPIVTTIAGGALGAGITASVIEAKKEDIKNKAVAEWMEDIGEHIQCFVGTDELGSYGDTIAIEID